MISKDDLVTVCGAGGFIGGHLVRFLHENEFQNIRAIDIKIPTDWFQTHDFAENLSLDLSHLENCRKAVCDSSWVFNLATDMGGIGYIEANRRACMLSVLINTHLLIASRDLDVQRFFFASSACVYDHKKQASPSASALREEDAYPANPQDGYGWEKLFSERLCSHFMEETNLITRVARFHNTFGPHGEYIGGKEKAPAAICRKVIEAKLLGHDEIEIWGSGRQERSFMYIDDCLHGIYQIMQNSDITFPINLGSTERISINRLVDLIEGIANITLIRKYKLDAPTGVQGRNSDNTLLRTHLNWEPSISLDHGLEQTYDWIYEQMA